MLKTACAGSSRTITCRSARNLMPARPAMTVAHAKVAHITPATPEVNPLYLTMTEPLKRQASDPIAKDSVVAMDPSVFNHPIRRDILHLCVVHYRDGLRQGSANTKTRGEVAGSGRKVRPQKGSGRARLGDAQSPMLRGGGVAFGPKPRDFSTKLPRKVIQMGMRVALSARMKEGQLGVMTRLDWPHAKTKTLAQLIETRGLRKTLFITGEDSVSEGLDRATRNIRSAKAISTGDPGLNVFEVLKWQKLILDVKAVEYFEQKLGKGGRLVHAEVTELSIAPQTPLL